MKILLIFILATNVVRSEVEGREKRGFPLKSFYHLDYSTICTTFIKGKYAECEGCAECEICARQVAREMENGTNSNEDKNEMSKSNMLKTKEVVIKCNKNMENNAKLVECTKMDEEEFISCVKAVFPVGFWWQIGWFYCGKSYKNREECEECMVSSFKEVWEKYSEKVQDSSETNEKDANSQFIEIGVTEIANNCNHFFQNRNMIKKCANQEFGTRLGCFHKAKDVYLYDVLVFELCSFSKQESMKEECDNCILEAIDTEDSIDTIDYKDELQEKEHCKKALEKCGQYFERQEEMLECTNMEFQEMVYCLHYAFVKNVDKKLAIKMCKNTAKSDECVECVYQSLQNAFTEFDNSRTSEEESTHRLDSLQFTEVSTNCLQHFEKEEELKKCRGRVYGDMMDCMLEVLSIDKN